MPHARFIQAILLSSCLWIFSPCGLAQQSPPDAPAAQGTPSIPSVADFAEARKLMQQGKFDDAIANLESIQAANPRANGLDLELGTAYYKKSDFSKAIEYLKKSFHRGPSQR